MSISIPKKPSYFEFGIDPEKIDLYERLKNKTDKLVKYLANGLAVFIAALLTIILLNSPSFLGKEFFKFSQSISGKIIVSFLLMLGLLFYQYITKFVLLYVPVSFFLSRIILGWKKTHILKDYKKNVEEYKFKVEHYNSRLRFFWETYPESKKFGENLDEYAKEVERQEIENENRRIENRKQLDYWLNLSGYEFESEVTILYRRIGFDALLTKGSGDGGIDVILYDGHRNKIIVQCKNHSRQISPSVVRELYGVMMAEKAIKAILICSGGFTQGVYAFAAGKPIELIDGKKLIELYKQSL